MGSRHDRCPCLARLAVALVAVFSGRVGLSQTELSPTAVIRRWDVNDGLPNARVFAIAHTPDGYAWLGTYGGLTRFDGVGFTSFIDAGIPELGSSGAMALAVDGDATLWIGTEEGVLVAHDRTGFRRVATPVRAGRRINAIQPGPDGRLWLGTPDGVVVFAPGTTQRDVLTEGLEVTDVTHLVLDSGGNAWALAGGTVHRLRSPRWEPARLDAGGTSKTTALAAAAAGGVWCATTPARAADGGGTALVRLAIDGGVETVAAGPWPRAPTRSRIEALLEDPDGRLWCATRGSGLYCRAGDGTWAETSKGTTLSRVDGIGLAADATGALWIGTRNSGVYQTSPTRVVSRRLPEAVGDHVATTVCARRDGSLWAGTDGGGVVNWQEDTVRQFGLDAGLPSLEIASAVEACGGRLFVATPRGMARLDGERFSPVGLTDIASDTPCSCLFVDAADQLWVGTVAGVVHLAGDAARPIRRIDGQPLDIVAFAQAADRIVALDRSGSLSEAAAGSFRTLPDVPDLSARARAIAADAEGSLWLGNYGAGITYVKAATSRRWSMLQNGLPSSHVLAIHPFADVMWVCSENGVFGCPLAEFTQAPGGRYALPTWRVAEIEGLPEKVCTAGGQPITSLGPDQRLWVPAGRFVAGFLPTEIMEPLPVFPPLVERVVVDGRDLPPTGPASRVLPAGSGRLEIHFTSPNTVAPQRLQFRHRLVGFDDRWVEIGNRRTASYTGLPPGEYQLRLEAGDPMGSWRSLREDLRLTIPPRFWQRRDVQAAFAIALALALAAAGWAWERRRSRARFARLALERAREQERQRIARDIHDDLGSGLTEIVMLSDVAARESATSPNADTVQAIADRARALTRAMDEVVWAVNPHNDSTEGFITYLHRWAQAYLGNAGLRVRWDLPVETADVPLSAEVRHQLFLACKEAVTNVVKHAAASEVRIGCSVLSGCLEIVIDDDGHGFSTTGAAPAGDGLANLRARLAALGGTCEIASKCERGTTVRLRVPLEASLPRHGEGVTS